jgi:hypothetical protein
VVVRKKLGELLVESQLITAEQLNQALRSKKPGERLGQVLVSLGYVTEQDIINVLEFQLGIPQIKLSELSLELNVVRLLPESIARRYNAIVRVVPGSTLSDEMASDAAIEQVGMDLAMKFEQEQGRQPEDVSAQALGYDIRSVDREGNYRYIEVKARARTGAIALTPNEWVMANRLGEEYWLYVVEQAAANPQLYLIQNPAACLKPDEQVEIVRYVVRNWRPAARRA